MEDINLHFTGDFHAIASAHALLAAMLDNHLQQGNALGIDPAAHHVAAHHRHERSRAARHASSGSAAPANGVPARGSVRHHPRQRDHGDRRARHELRRISRSGWRASSSAQRRGGPKTRARRRPQGRGRHGAPAQDAIRPNLVQTLEGGPGLRARGSVRQHRARLQHDPRHAVGARAIATSSSPKRASARTSAPRSSSTSSAAGRTSNPEAAVLVATVRALKLNGGANKKHAGTRGPAARWSAVCPTSAHHIENVSPVRRSRRGRGEPLHERLATPSCRWWPMSPERAGVRVALNEVWAKGGDRRRRARARGTGDARRRAASHFAPHLRRSRAHPREDRHRSRPRVYGGRRRRTTRRRPIAPSSTSSPSGLGDTPICMAKTQYSLTDDATRLGRPRGFRITVNEVYPVGRRRLRRRAVRRHHDHARSPEGTGRRADGRSPRRLHRRPLLARIPRERHRTLHTDRAPAAIGPYSQAVVAGGFVFTAGQIAIDPATGQVDRAATSSPQTERVLANLTAVLAAAGAGWCDVVKTTVFLSRHGRLPARQ